MANSFILHVKYAKIINDLSNEQAGALLKMIYQYQVSGTICEISDLEVKSAFKFIRLDLDYNNSKYEKKCEKNRENAKRGGAPKNNNNAKKQADLQNNRMVEKTTERLKNNPTVEKQPNIDVDVDVNIDVDVDNNNNKDKDRQAEPAAASPPLSAGNTLPVISSAVCAWNKFAVRKKLPQVVSVSASRRKKLLARVKQGMDISAVLAAAGRQSFLFGNNKQGWALTFDFLIDNDQNWLKVLEGAYGFDIKAPPAVRPPDPQEEEEEKSVEQIEAENAKIKRITQENAWLQNILRRG